MFKKKVTLRKQINKRLDEMDVKVPNNKPSIAFIGKLPDGRYEVVEHYNGKNSNGIEVTLKYVDKIIDTKEEYFSQKPDWKVFYGEAPLVEVLKDLLKNQPWQIAKEY
ncbi:hypothetical protein HYG86_11380 [Alkalicella caledoniensis]|uniref:Uncharacterized protein n=1 Tax=Alkalicella caledoniensis TaxID=2731377 RepID=A0A7G9W9G2_ALKCA|nr:hypothetical protein [Alkalicella caledoniensis]QNO15324.1 hypothetical protein HYG86_11380 [Alkalicella caledoniensis]